MLANGALKRKGGRAKSTVFKSVGARGDDALVYSRIFFTLPEQSSSMVTQIFFPLYRGVYSFHIIICMQIIHQFHCDSTSCTIFGSVCVGSAFKS